MVLTEAGLRSHLDALVEQIETRVISVNNGETISAKTRQRHLHASGAAISDRRPLGGLFDASRDMRLIIAIMC